ncbi:Glutathione S-transferase N-terminal [Penicillium soppii]|uniref:Glutathione S-transferase N-terminal n=1 Tax=Penicillium soppii TaxID=69789 RepID=UPI002549008B|nr:Glutathione S-transferase N-terminal [Penicillium soppii]KAJ5881592.1 Glutathione S-transferase N-terminal [Penicillium soppii]
MAPSQYLLYDIPSGKAPCATWSPNPWKTRLLLNFKGLDYQTQWVEYPDIKSTLENHVTPNEGSFPYTCPTLACPDGTYVMDSRKIADYIERQAPLPSLHLDSIYLEKVERLWSQYMGAIKPIFVPLVPRQILNEESVGYWNSTREQAFGMSLDQLEREKGGERAWNEAEPALREVTALLQENEGPFFLGNTVSYADLVWGSILLFNQRLGSDIFDEALKRSGDSQVHLNLLKAVQPWA